MNSNRIVEDLPRVLLAGNLTMARFITPNSTSVYASYNLYSYVSSESKNFMMFIGQVADLI